MKGPQAATATPRSRCGAIARLARYAAVVVLGSLVQAQAAIATETRPGRLPNSVSPVHYEVLVQPDAAALTFKGRETIDIDVHVESQSITLNALDLELGDVALDGQAPAGMVVDPVAQTATFRFSTPVTTGRHQLALSFSGTIRTNATGLFAVDYSTDDGPRRMLSMQLEPADGRRFLPMWDEPSAKATFAIEVVIPRDQDAFSNMPEASRRIVGDSKHVRFQTTPKMSSYLLHLTVGELERTSRIVAGVDVGVVTRKGVGDRTRFALDSSAEVLPWFNEYFGTPYPLPKLDMIAVPGQSQFFGAMENWGAILYFEPYLLVDPARTSESQRQAVFETVAHEVAHQWFGNLVTMEWWTDLWLNEGFATWMAGKVMAARYPQWQPWLQAVSGTREHAMQLDAGSATHPVVMPVVSIDAVSQAFDEISYSKGATVVRMIEETIGEAGFREGIRRYMKKYAYGNARTDQLWEELQAATGKPVRAIAHDFTLQPGVPLVRVGETTCRDEVTSIELTPSRFETDGIAAQKLAWRIPIRAQAIGNETTASVITGPGAPVTMQVPGCGPVIVNAGQAGYFRTLYAPAERARLRDAFASIPEIDQLGLLSDAWALGNVGLVPATAYLDFVEVVAAESDVLIWTQVASRLGAIDRIFDGSAEQETWRRLARAILVPQLQRVGWVPSPGQGDNVALLRESLIGALGALHDDAVITEARDRYRRAARDPAALPAAIRNVVMEVTALHADAATWEDILARARKEADPLEKQRWYTWLGRPKDPALAKRALELAVSGEPPAGAAPTIMYVVALRHAEMAFDFAVANEKAVNALIEASSRWRFLPSLARSSANTELAQKLRTYAEAASVPVDARLDTEKSIAEIERRARSRALSRPQLEAWARERQASSTPVQARLR